MHKVSLLIGIMSAVLLPAAMPQAQQKPKKSTPQEALQAFERAVNKQDTEMIDILFKQYPHIVKDLSGSGCFGVYTHRGAKREVPPLEWVLVLAKKPHPVGSYGPENDRKIVEGWLNVAKCLVRNGFSPNARNAEGKVPLWSFVGSTTPYTEAIKFLIDSGADVDLKDARGVPPVVATLVDPDYFESQQRANIDAFLSASPKMGWNDYDGNTFLHHWAKSGSYQPWEIYRDRLPKAPAFVNRKNVAGSTALHLRLSNITHDPQPLLDLGADPNLTDAQGNTALHLAVKHELKTVKLVLAAKAKVDVKNKAGKTPLDLALTNGNSAVYKLLLESATKQ